MSVLNSYDLFYQELKAEHEATKQKVSNLKVRIKNVQHKYYLIVLKSD